MGLSLARRIFLSEVSDVGWVLVALYLTLVPGDLDQRVHRLLSTGTEVSAILGFQKFLANGSVRVGD